MSEPPTNPAATSCPAPTTSLPLGLGILITYSGALICMEIVFGGLVWTLVASSNVPVPLLQGWVMFVSVTMFFCSTAYLILFLSGLADRINTDWNFLDMLYHFTALLFYFGAFLLEAATTAASYSVARPDQAILTVLNVRQYNINVATTPTGQARHFGGSKTVSDFVQDGERSVISSHHQPLEDIEEPSS